MSGTVTFTPVQDDLLRAFKLHYPLFQPKRFVFFIAFCALIGLAMAILAGDTTGTETVAIIASMMAFGTAMIIVLQTFVRLWWIPRHIGRVFKQQADLRKETTISWNDEKLSLRSINAHSDLPWNEFHQWCRNDRMLLIYRSELLFNFFPIDSQEKQSAADDIQAHLVGAGVKQRP